MYRYLLVLLCVGVCVATPQNAQVPLVYVPPHVPMEVVGPTPVFDVPWWLGGFIATTNQSSTWILPLTYQSGGRTNAGSALVIQNQGPFNITLYTQASETIQGSGSYLIVADSSVQILSALDWVVVSNTFGTTSNDGMFNYLQTQNESIACWLGVGTNNPINQQCGDFSSTRAFVGNMTPSALPSSDAGALKVQMLDSASTSGTSIMSVFEMQIAPQSATTANYRGFQTQITVLPNTLFSPTNLMAARIGANIGSNVHLPSVTGITIQNNGITGVAVSADTVIGAFVRPMVTTTLGAINTIIGAQISSPSQVSGFYGTNIMLDLQGFSGANTTAVAIRFTPPGSAINSYGIWANTNTASCAAGLVSGTAGDTCLYRAAANRWTFNAGTSLSVPGYVNLGSGSAPSNTAAGAFSTTKVTPTLQAFGAVTANAASGVLAFTVSTAAVTCGTAVVTNTNVVAGSEVILTIQSYTGTRYTNGVPIISRADTAGSSAGSFTLQLCNDHATNALSGNLYVAFWVLN